MMSVIGSVPSHYREGSYRKEKYHRVRQYYVYTNIILYDWYWAQMLRTYDVIINRKKSCT